MTTATRPARPSGILVRTALASLAVLGSVVLVAALVSGSRGATGAAVGGALVLVVFSGGTFALELMTRKSAEIALLVAMVTYSGQIIVVLGVLIGLTTSGLADDLSRGWLAAAVVAGSAVWSTAQIVLASRARIPAYDLAETADNVPARQESLLSTSPERR